jgi:hypothetical protein
MTFPRILPHFAWCVSILVRHLKQRASQNNMFTHQLDVKMGDAKLAVVIHFSWKNKWNYKVALLNDMMNRVSQQLKFNWELSHQDAL